jgi:hypothetical protein
MVNNSMRINQMNDNLSLLIIELTKTLTYTNGNSGSRLGNVQKYDRVKLVNGISPPLLIMEYQLACLSHTFDNGISTGLFVSHSE